MVSTLLLDLDGVLIQSGQANMAFFRRVMTLVGHSASLSSTFNRQALSLTMIEFFREVLPDEHEVERAMAVALEEPYPFDLVGIDPEVCLVLEQITLQYEVGVVTGRVRRDAEKLLMMLNLAAPLVAFEDCIRPKPDPEGLLKACELLKVSPSDCVYVGDAPSDMAAAAAAGMSSIRVGVAEDPSAVACIEGFVDILPALESANLGI